MTWVVIASALCGSAITINGYGLWVWWQTRKNEAERSR